MLPEQLIFISWFGLISFGIIALEQLDSVSDS